MRSATLLTILLAISLAPPVGAGVIVEMDSRERQSMRSAPVDLIAHLQLLAEQDQPGERINESPFSEVATVVWSGTTPSLSGIEPNSWPLVATAPQADLLKVPSQSLPQAPDRDGLLKPPQPKHLSTV